jgi:sugar porter (SP) family MFS transporter
MKILTKALSSSSSTYDSTTTTTTTSSRMLLQLNLLGLFVVCLTPMLGGLLYGMDIGVTSFVLAMLLMSSSTDTSTDECHDGIADATTTTTTATITECDDHQWWWTDISSIQQGLIVSAISLGALLGSHIVLMYLSTRIGRRMELRLSAMCFVIGTSLNCLSGSNILASTTSFVFPAFVGFLTLFVGRLIFGVGVGFVMHGAAAYLAEMVPPEIRGAVVSFKETVIVSGIVIGYAVGNAVSSSTDSDPTQWARLYAYTGWVAIPMFVLTFWIPRSKRWLILHGLQEEAYESMTFIYRGENIRDEFERLVESVTSSSPPTTTADYSKDPKQQSSSSSSPPPSLLDPRYRKAMIASMGLIIFQQCSGQPSVLSYATVLFQAAGWSGNASVVTSVLMMVTSMTTVLLIERLGRKTLLCACCAVMVVALSALSTAFWGWGDGGGNDTDSGVAIDPNDDSAQPHPQRYIILMAMFIYIGGYQLGFGPITWTIVSEVFPIEIRGTAIAAGVELNYGLNFAIQFIFPIVQERLGWGPSFCLFASILAFAFFFIGAFVPETTGLSLEEIQFQLLNNGGDHHDPDKQNYKQLSMTESSKQYFDGDDTTTSLLTRVDSSSILLGGALMNIDEMETQLIRKQSYSSMAKIQV